MSSPDAPKAPASGASDPGPLFSEEARRSAEQAIRTAIGAGLGYDGAADAVLSCEGVRREVERQHKDGYDSGVEAMMSAHELRDDLCLALRGATAEIVRLRALVGEEGQPGWDTCSRAEAIRQANEKHDALLREMVLSAERWRQVADLRARQAAVESVLAQADSGEFATAGRDFGRGVAELARRVRAALSGDGEPAEVVESEPNETNRTTSEATGDSNG